MSQLALCIEILFLPCLFLVTDFKHLFICVLYFRQLKVFNTCVSAATALVEGKIGKSLKKVLKKVVAKEAHEQLAISDAKLGGVIKVSIHKFVSLAFGTCVIHRACVTNGPLVFRKRWT